jgi:hypothetical protein
VSRLDKLKEQKDLTGKTAGMQLLHRSEKSGRSPKISIALA